MAFLWQHKTTTTDYEVRSAGQSIRLYSNGVFHSQWNPQNVIGGALWDLLAIPVFFLPSKPRRVLVLGVGGGAVICQLRAMVAPQSIIGVDIDQTHLRIARRFFGVTEKLYCEDARRWLQDYQGPPFDYIVDDLFSHGEGEAVRAIKVDSNWASLLTGNLAQGGVLAINFADGAELRGARSLLLGCVDNKAAGLDPQLYSFSHKRYHNRIGVLVKSQGQQEVAGRELWKLQLQHCETLTKRQRLMATQYACRRLT